MPDASTEYILHYRHDGQVWALSLFAIDDVDAERKVQSVRASLELKGRLLGVGATLEQAAQVAAKLESGEVLRRLAANDPKFGNLGPDGVHTTDGRTIAPGGVRNPDGTISDATRNPDGTYSGGAVAGSPTHNPDGSLHGNPAAPNDAPRNPDGTPRNPQQSTQPAAQPTQPRHANPDGSYVAADGSLHNKDGTIRE